MPTVNLGRVGYVHKGTYDPAAIYEKYDVVFYNHGSFLYIGESASGHSPLDPAYWQAMLDPAEMNKATAAAVAAVDKFNQRISSLASPFSVSGNPVSCYPVRDYPLQVISHFLPLQAGQGDPAPGNIRPLSPVSRFSLFHGEKEIPAYLENPLYGGDYHWQEGKITDIAGYLELDGTEGWYLNSNGDTSYFVLNFPDVTAIENKAYMSHFSNHPGLAFSDPSGKYNVFRWQNHNSGVTRLCVRPDLKQYATLDAFKAFLAAQKAAGTPVQLVYFADDPAEETGYPKEEILSGAGENTFSTDNGTVTVSGPLDPAYQNAMQDERISDLEEGAIGGGSYTLPIASAETLGGVKVGDGLTVDADGKVSVEPEEGYALIKEITIKAEQVDLAEIIEEFDQPGYDGLIVAMTVSNPAQKTSAYIAAGWKYGFRMIGGVVCEAGQQQAMRVMFTQKDGIWDISGYQGHQNGETLRAMGQVSPQKISYVREPDDVNFENFKTITYMRLYTFDIGGFPEGLNIKIFGKVAKA